MLFERLAVIIQIQCAVFQHIDGNNVRTFLRADHLPGDDVGVVLHAGHQHGIAGSQVGPAPGLCHQVDGVRRAGSEDDFFGAGGVDVGCNLAAAAFIGFRGQLCEVVGATVDVGVVVRQVFPLSLYDGKGLLGAGRIVQIDQGLAVNLAVEDRKVLADAFGQGGHGHLQSGTAVRSKGSAALPPREVEQEFAVAAAPFDGRVNGVGAMEACVGSEGHCAGQGLLPN